MSPELIAVVEPFVRRGLFPNAEMAVAEIRVTMCCAKSSAIAPWKRLFRRVTA